MVGAKQYSGEMMFFKMLVDPILNLLNRVLEDPINTVIDILPNLLYFLTAEPVTGDEQYAKNKGTTMVGGTTCLNECLNRLLRPIYAILDMLAPLLTINDLLVDLLPEFGLDLGEMFEEGLPISFELFGAFIEINLPLKLSLNDIVDGLVKGLLPDLLDDLLPGLKIDLGELTSLITGELELYKSQNGQDDAVRLNGNLPDLLTNLIRRLLAIIFGEEENYDVLMGLLDGLGLPDVLSPAVEQLIGSLYGLMADRTLQGHIGADLILSMLFYLFYDANSLVDELLAMRDRYSARVISIFEVVAGSSSPQQRRYAERARRILNMFYGDIISPDDGVQRKGFWEFIMQFFAKITDFFSRVGTWFSNLFAWIFPF